jgi:RimJ/RimL family protein N-acetyltransferase
MSDEEAADWMSEQLRDSQDPQRRHWVIQVDDSVVGVVFLHSINEPDRRARFAIGLFSPQFMGLGLGSEATRLVLQYAFTDMGLHRVDLRVLEFNETARRAYERCGFVLEGRERESCWLGGRWYDDLLMGVLAQEFTGVGHPGEST